MLKDLKNIHDRLAWVADHGQALSTHHVETLKEPSSLNAEASSLFNIERYQAVILFDIERYHLVTLPPGSRVPLGVCVEGGSPRSPFRNLRESIRSTSEGNSK